MVPDGKGKTIKEIRVLTVNLIKPHFIPLNNNETMIVFEDLFHENLLSRTLKVKKQSTERAHF